MYIVLILIIIIVSINMWVCVEKVLYELYKCHVFMY